MRHLVLAGQCIRCGVLRGLWAYQPFVGGRLQISVGLFPDRGSERANEAYFMAHYEPVVRKNGDIFVMRKEHL
jgi:hypothetical protein